jgi:hypothetical protein
MAKFVSHKTTGVYVEFSSTQEFLQIPEVTACSLHEQHSHFVVNGRAVLSIRDDGHACVPLGYVLGTPALDLPAWTGIHYRVKNAKGEYFRVHSKDVRFTHDQLVHTADSEVLTMVSKEEYMPHQPQLQETAHA